VFKRQTEGAPCRCMHESFNSNYFEKDVVLQGVWKGVVGLAACRQKQFAGKRNKTDGRHQVVVSGMFRQRPSAQFRFAVIEGTLSQASDGASHTITPIELAKLPLGRASAACR